MNVLAVFAHPDDEVLACGGTLARHVADGDAVSVLVFTDGVAARSRYDNDAQRWAVDMHKRADEFHSAMKLLRINNWYRCCQLDGHGWPDQELDTVPVLELARCVEDFILPDTSVVYTHWPGDLNQDHRAVAEATLIATRPVAGGCSQKVFACEIPESSAHGFGRMAFTPTTFVDISAHLAAKVQALRCYESEKRLPPHPRSEANVVAHAAVRGAAAGVDFAEAFMLVREVVA